MAEREIIRVLLVENRDAERKAIMKIIKSAPYIIIADVAVSGYEAITKAIRLIPDVVLVNTEMETTVAGIFICKEICETVPGAKVILYGKDCADNIIYKGFQAGAANFIIGELDASDLIDAIRGAFRGKASVHYSSAIKLRGEFKRILDLQDNLIYVLNVVIKLTPAEFRILKLLYNGMRYNEIKKILFISVSTMKTHISHILKKFNLEKMSQVINVIQSTEFFSLIKISPDDLL